MRTKYIENLENSKQGEILLLCTFKKPKISEKPLKSQQRGNPFTF